MATVSVIGDQSRHLVGCRIGPPCLRRGSATTASMAHYTGMTPASLTNRQEGRDPEEDRFPHEARVRPRVARQALVNRLGGVGGDQDDRTRPPRSTVPPRRRTFLLNDD